MKIPITGTQRLNAVTITTPAFDWRTAAVLLFSLVIGLGSGQAFAEEVDVTHVFSIDDIVGDFQGSTYGTAGNQQDTSIICSGAGCPTVKDKDQRDLYGIDSEFGFYVTDFAGAIPKLKDVVGYEPDYMEGFAANIEADGQVIGISVANVATDTFRTQAGRGTWCSGLGNTSVKCSAEQYVVMEHVKTCHETIPYMEDDPERADPADGDQAVLEYDGDPAAVDCADYKLDNALYIIGGVFDEDGVQIPGLEEGTLIESAQILYDGENGWLLPNESTVLENIAASADYSVTGKDDGKPLYRWGDLHKRPNDIRMYARMPLPDEWKDPLVMAQNGGLGLRVESATLEVHHVVTNNPNDQLRPEDMENEGAIGRKPGGIEVDGVGLVSNRNCYEADSDFIPALSVYRNDNFPFPDHPLVYPVVGATEGTDPYRWSSDLKKGWTNGYYTTVDREPFEWSYDPGDGDLVGSQFPDDTLGTLVSGPRWRMTAQKFGQTVPGLEIPTDDCLEPPYQKEDIKYAVGADWTTVINLLDWNPTDERSVGLDLDEPPDGLPDESPLAYTNGWVDESYNLGAVVNPEVPVSDPERLQAVSINGAPITDDFDLSVYVKGDKKATKVFSARLEMTVEDYVPPLVVTAVSVNAPDQAVVNQPIPVSFTVNNPNAAPVTADVQICGLGDALVLPYDECSAALVGATLDPEADTIFPVWDAPATANTQTITWTGTLSNISTGDADDTETAVTEIVDIPPEVDVAAVSLDVPTGGWIRFPDPYDITFTVSNVGPTATDVDVQVCWEGTDRFGIVVGSDCLPTDSITNLAVGAEESVVLTWLPSQPEGVPYMYINWTGTAVAAGDIDPSNDSVAGSGTTLLRLANQ